MKVALAVVFVIAILKGVDSNPTGAPQPACDPLRPSAGSPHGANAQQTPVPYGVNYTTLDMVVNATSTMFGYYPGRTYTITFQGTGDIPPTFRGVLMQTRTYVDDTPVGTFAVTDGGNIRLSACTPNNNIGITHNSNDNKSMVYFDWTAPSAGTGPISFRFAVVQGPATTFWANQSSAVVQELDADGLVATTMMPPTTDGAVKLSIGIQSLDILDENPTQFRGFLVQSRLVADDGTNVGTFGEVAASMDVTRLSSCPRPEDGITHSERINAPGVYFSWTAPDNGTGSVVFRFAIVQTLNVHWADQTSMMIAEYGSNSTGDACMVAVTGVTTDGAAQLNGIGFWTVLVAALVVAVKAAL